MSTNKKTNRLIAEKSPYLLQHAYNPVDWYPWGDEAFDKAKKENKPIFLSIGYSTCHWCHVMERESFENEEVAKLLNDHYIAIKVDREERPDIDSIYMNVCQMMNEGHGGWPLTIIMTPDQVPFYAGTYFPKNSHYGRPGMTEMLPQLARVYHEESHKITETTEQVMNALQHTHQTDREEIKEEVLHEAFAQLKGQFDGIHGGFGQAPKFPIPHQLMFLLRYHQLTGNELALQMVTKTLDSMASGGIYDHVGYGFARYSVDEMWLIPHFEKMLYDNALLLHVYAEAYQLTKAERYKRICYEIIEFVQREMTNEQGGFLSAVDADSEGEEGKFYVWTKEEVIRVLGEEDGEVFCSVYDITEEGNFEGENIPNLIRSDIGQWEIYFGMELDELNDLLEHARRKLFHERDKRVHPHVDDKVLTAWNGLMIAALAKAGAVFEDATILQSARRSVQFIEKNLWKKEALFARWREGEEKFFGYLDDYAFLLWGYIELYLAEGKSSDLEKALLLKEEMFARFDDEKGGFYFTDLHGEKLLVREKESYDGALPSGNSVASLQLWRLAKLTKDEVLIKHVEKSVESFSYQLSNYPMGSLYMLQTVMAFYAGGRELAVMGKGARQQKALASARTSFLPFDVWTENGEAWGFPFSEELAVYICENHACRQPIHELERALSEISKAQK